MRPLKIKSSYEVKISPDGGFCLALGRDVNLWDINVRKKAWKTHPFSHPSHGDFSPDGSWIAIKSTAGRILVLDRSNGEIIRDFENQSDGEGSNLLFTSCGKHLIDGSWGGLLTVREVSSGRVLFRQQFSHEMITRIHAGSDTSSWFSEHHPKWKSDESPIDESYFLRWTGPIENPQPLRLRLTHTSITSSAFSKCGARLALVHGYKPAQMVTYDLGTQSALWSQQVKLGGSGSAMAWSPCGNFLACIQEEQVAVYDSKSGALLSVRQLAYPSDVAFSPDGTQIAVGSWQDGFVTNFIPSGLV
jgi:WD40 repeat protein